MRVLLAEDDRDLSVWLGRLLRQDSVIVDCVHCGDEADEALATQSYALVILDLGLPGIAGLEVLQRFRKRNTTTPVLILTANDAISSRVAGLDAGADDYLIKPFDVAELQARVRAQLRRGSGNKGLKISLGLLELDCSSRVFQVAGDLLHLTVREHALLEALLRNAGRTVSKTQLADSIFGFNDDASSTALEIHIHRLRKKIEGKGVEITTLRGLGYVLRLEAPC